MHFRRQLVAPGELGLVKVWGPYLSLLHANLWSRLPAAAAPAIAFPQTRPYLFTAIRARFSPLLLLHDTRMASHGFTSGFQSETGCTTVLHFRCVFGQDLPMTITLQIQ